MAGDKANTPSKGQAWFCTTGLPSDVVIQLHNMTFHLHRFPLMSKSKKLHDLITEQEIRQKATTNKHAALSDDDSQIDELDQEEQQCHVSLPNFPGGSETFEAAAKFCYGVKVELTATKVAPLRCAGEALEMTEEYAENNLISKTERFLNNHVLNNIKDSIKALKSCEHLGPLAENLGIVERCVHAISAKASLYDPTLFGWPVNEPRNKSSNREAWVEDLALLSAALFNKVVKALNEEGISPEILDSCLMHYAKRWFPGITRTNRKPVASSSSTIASEAEQREVLENIVSNLCSIKSSKSPAATRFLFGLLRTANILHVSDACKAALERRIGCQLEQATLDDLLVPSYSYLNETLYDVECVERILGYFLERCEEDSESVSSAGVMLVGKLIDGYLSEIASDSNLKPEKFFELAMSLPDQARLYDDGVYRAVDVYLKAHPWLSEEEREKISGVMNFEKLTLEACTHAAQNERLPLRAVVQVLFFEQLQLRHAIAGTLLTAEAAATDSTRPSIYGRSDDERSNAGRAATPNHQNRDDSNGMASTWKTTIRENQVLRLDMDSMRTRVHELERECSTMKKFIERIDKVGSPQNNESNNNKGNLKKGSFTRKFGCKFKTQVCDSHESTVVDTRKDRHQRNQR